MAAPVATAEFRFGIPLRVSLTESDEGPAENADVAYDSGQDTSGEDRDRYMVVWQGEKPDQDEGPEIYGAKVSRSNLKINPEFKVSNTPGTLPSEEPAIAFNRQRKEFMVLWAAKHSDADAKEIYGQRRTVGGGPAASKFRVSITRSGRAPFEASVPDLAYNNPDSENPALGKYLAVWRSDADVAGEYEIFGQMLAGDGGALGTDFRISHMGPDGDANFGAYDPSVAYDSVNDRFLVTWSGDAAPVAGEHEIYTRAYDGDGSSLPGGQKLVSDMGPDGDTNFDAFEPALAFNRKEGEYLLVWRGDDTGHDNEYEVYAQRLGADNAELVPTDFRVSDMGPDGDPAYAVGARPTVEYLSESNRYLVLWHGDDNTSPLVDDEMEIFGQALSANGQEWGTNDFQVSNPRTAGPPRRFPQAAYNPKANQTLVVWQGPGAEQPLQGIYSRRVGDDRDGDRAGDMLIDGEGDLCPTESRGPFDVNVDGCPDDRDADTILDQNDPCASVAGGAFDANRDGCPDDTDGDNVLDERDRCRTTPAGRLDRNHNGCPGPFGSLRGARLDTSVFDYRRFIRVELLRFRDLPRRKVTVSLRCIRRCRIQETLSKPAGRRTVRSRRFKHRRLRAGAVIAARITATDLIGSLRRYEVRRGDLHEITKARACIPIDFPKPRKKCDPGR